MALPNRARPVERQLQHRLLAAQQAGPVRQLALLFPCLHPAALPQGVVRVLDRQSRQRYRALDYRRHRAGPVPRPSPASTNRRTRCDAGPAPAHGRPRPAATGSPAAAHAPGRTAARSSSRPAERGRPRSGPNATISNGNAMDAAISWRASSPSRRKRCVGSRAAQPGCRSCVAGHPGPAAHVDARHSGYGRPRFPAPVARETTVAPGHGRAAGARRPGA